MLARPIEDLPRRRGLWYEAKWDGFRCIRFARPGGTYLQARRGTDMGGAFPEIVRAADQLAELPAHGDPSAGAAMRRPGYLTPDQIRLRAELEEARSLIRTCLIEAIGPGLDRETVQAVLEGARAWRGPNAHALAEHLRQHPDALTSSSPHCPAVLVRVLDLLVNAGHGATVARVACADCGRTSPLPCGSTFDGRVCGTCASRRQHSSYARCGKVRRLHVRRPEGTICKPSRDREPDARQECENCHRLMICRRNGSEGRLLCQICCPVHRRRCVRCGRQRRVNAHTPQGPVCSSCYTSPPRKCGVCGRIASIRSKAKGGQPDICGDCYQEPKKPCCVCGRIRQGQHIDKGRGAFHCSTCTPRPLRTCGICGQQQPVKTTWPLGPVCDRCYRWRRRTPAPCSQCGRSGILVGRTDEGEDLCGACCGHQNSAAACARCSSTGLLRPDSLCPHYSLTRKVRSLLSTDENTVPPVLEPLADVLAQADNPYPVLEWLRRSPVSTLLASLAQEPTKISHQTLDAPPPNNSMRYVRDLLVTAGILPRRDENFARLEIWLARTLTQLPAHHVTIIRPFAEWGVVRDARRRSTRGRYSLGAYKGDCRDIRFAAAFLTWLDTQNIQFASLTQTDLDLWLIEHPTMRSRIIPFLRWAKARNLTHGVTLHYPPSRSPEHFQPEDLLHRQLHRRLHEATLPLEVRLYALPLSRIVELTADHFHRDAQATYLTLDRHPMVLPPALAHLIETQFSSLHGAPAHQRQLHDATGYLLPGHSLGRPRISMGLADTLRRYELPVRAARNTAMMEAITDLPPAVVADLFGLTPPPPTDGLNSPAAGGPTTSPPATHRALRSGRRDQAESSCT